MLSSAIVIFREVFEIVLILGVVIAATRGIPHSKKAVGFGLVGGVAGSALVALFTDAISELAEGMGQEVFNALILFTAAFFIGWTVLWMKSHAHEMKARFTEVGQAVSEGRLPFISLSLIIALAVLREGSEIVLFTYGMMAAGEPVLSLAAGSLIGIVSGLAVGLLLYKGLLKLSMRHFFSVTSWLLVFLVAGMMSQGVGFLVAAGAFENFSYIVWDSSWLLHEGNILGESLKTLIGYTARPTAAQLAVYVLTLGTLAFFMKIIEKNKKGGPAAGKKQMTAAALLILGAAGFALVFPTQAHATKKVYAPYVEAGELELEFRGGYDIDDDSDVDGAWKQKYAVGYGVNDFWFTEIYGEFEKEGERGADTEFTAVEWENRFQLTQPGEYWLDLGLLTEYKYNTEGGADKVEAKLLLAKDVGDYTHLANLILERQIGEDSNDETEGGLGWSSRYRYKKSFEPGFEIHSDFGSLSGDGQSYDEQKHLAGPVAYGKIGRFKYDAGVLFGVSSAAPDATLKAILEYEWHF